ncbi:MAG: hypothetical protein CL840_08790 [Crocinitomicaceae bacterium]|nr:hypothetical protein [Crocinitomicaceae bacterium]|tara:strand:+ start:55169 stop:56026 length:858 start_codon:yes stop_codon:yes gene_type:complete
MHLLLQPGVKLGLAFLLFFVNIHLSAQDFNDEIETKDHVIIPCKITLVNNLNIFYKYKKGKKTKTAYIPKEQVLRYDGLELESVTLSLSNSKMYSKCDTCENWFSAHVDNSPDSNKRAYNDLTVRFLKADTTLIESISWTGQYGVRKFGSCDVNEAYWNGRKYFTVYLDLRYEPNLLRRYSCNHFLGYYVIKGDISLIKYASSYLTNQYRNHGIPMATNEVEKTNREYCIEIDSVRIKIPRKDDQFRAAIKELFHHDDFLIHGLEKYQWTYDDIERIVKLYIDSL